jgi:hypothetical protein
MRGENMEKGMKIVGYSNTVTKSGNKGVNVCVTGEFTQWEKENRKPVGIKAEMLYVSGRHLEPEQIGTYVEFQMGMWNGKPYVVNMFAADGPEE